MVHVGLQTKRDEEPMPMAVRERGVSEQIEQRVRKSLRLKSASGVNAAESPDDGVTWADHHGPVGIDGSSAFPELPGETLLQASEFGSLRFVEAQVVGEELPRRNRDAREQGTFDPTEPTHEQRGVAPRDPIRD